MSEVSQSPEKKKPKERNLSEVGRSNQFSALQGNSNEKARSTSVKPKDIEDPKAIEISSPSLLEKSQVNTETSLVTLKIRTETGQRTLIVKALEGDKISGIYDLIREHSETANFELWGGYPPQPYPNADGISLEDIGIYGESVFNLRATSPFKQML